MEQTKKKSHKWIWIIGIIMVFILFLIFYTGGKSAVCGTHIETYNSNVKGCDKQENCECLHKSWLGLGSCDSCECTRVVSNC